MTDIKTEIFPQIQITKMRTADLKAAPYNPRRISDAALSGLEQSLQKFGVVQPIIFNKRSGYVVGGHQRVKVLRSHKITELIMVKKTITCFQLEKVAKMLPFFSV